MENNGRNAMFCTLKDGVSTKPVVIGTTFHFSKQAKSISDMRKLKASLRHSHAWVLSQDDNYWYLSYDEKILNRDIYKLLKAEETLQNK